MNIFEDFLEEMEDIKDALFEYEDSKELDRILNLLRTGDLENASEDLKDLYYTKYNAYENNLFYNLFTNWLLRIDDIKNKGFLIDDKGEFHSIEDLENDGAIKLSFLRDILRKVDPMLIGKLYIPSHIREIGEECFDKTFLNEVYLPDTIDEIGKDCFGDSVALRKVNIPRGIIEIPPCCFWGCDKLEEISLPRSLKVIERYAFRHCTSLKEITFNGNIKRLEDYCFVDCNNLETINLNGENLEYIGKGAFKHCYNLKEFLVKRNEYIEVDEDAFYNCNECTITIYTERGIYHPTSFNKCREVNLKKYNAWD